MNHLCGRKYGYARRRRSIVKHHLENPMSSLHKIIGTTSLGIALLYGIPTAAANNDNRGDRQSRSETIEATYSGPEEVPPPTMPSISYETPAIPTNKERGNQKR